jgi:hypothetical protein
MLFLVLQPLDLESKTLNDPLRMTPEDLKSAYSFVVVKSPVAKSVVQRRKPPSLKDTTPSPVKATKRKLASASKADQGSKTAAPPNKRKSSTQAAQAVTAARTTAQRKKSELSKQQQQSQQKQQQLHLQQQQQPPMLQTPNQHHQMQQPQFPQTSDQAFQPRPIMSQPQQQHTQQPGPSRQQPMTQQQQANQYNQFMSVMPSPIGTQQQRGSFSQFPNTPQMNQFHMIQQQQQQQQQPNQQQMNYGQNPQVLQQMHQFFPQMGPPQYPQQPMQMPGQRVVGPPGTMPMNIQPNNTNTSGIIGSNKLGQNMPSADDQSDPLFMLKDM